MNKITGWEIKYILLKFGDLEWMSCGSVDYNDPITIKTPSYAAWRFKDPDPKIEQAIVDAVNSFKGNVEWIITVKTEGNRNWVIQPKKVAQYREEGKVDKKWGLTVNYIAEHEPEFGISANNDIPSLAKHIEKYLLKIK